MEVSKNYTIDVSVYAPITCNMGHVHKGTYNWHKLTDSAGRILKFTKKGAEHYVEVYSNGETGCYKIEKCIA